MTGSKITKEVPRDFVFAGLRIGKGDKKVIKLIPLDDDNKMLEPIVIGSNRAHDPRVVGGVYSGVRFSDGAVHGLNLTKFLRMWPDKLALLEWTAQQDECETYFANLRREKANSNNAIDAELLTLRKLYAEMEDRFDRHGCRALETAVINSLRTRPRVKENT